MRKAALLCIVSILGCGGTLQKAAKPTALESVKAPDPEIVSMNGAVTNRFVSAGESSDLVARLRIDTRAIVDTERPPINLALVVDTSGSMDGEAIADARTAARSLVGLLSAGDRLAVVVFHSKTEVLVPSTRLDPTTTEKIKARLDDMKAYGTTDMAGGMRAGIREVASHVDKRGINRIVLLSDGIPNEEGPILGLAQQARSQGVSITALGLGLEYNETLLGRVAEQSGGRFHFIENSENVAGIFKDEVLRLQRVVARNMQLVLTPGPGIAVREVIGRTVGRQGTRSYVVHLGDLSEGETLDVFVRIAVGGRKVGATVELMDAVLGFQDAVAEAGRLERNLFLAAKASEDPEQMMTGANLDVQRAVAHTEAAVAIVKAIAAARAGQIRQAHEILKKAEAAAREAAVSLSDENLLAKADEMARLHEALPAVVSTPVPSPGLGVQSHTRPMAIEAGDAALRVRRSHSEAVSTLQSH